MADLFKELVYDKVITVLNLNTESVVFKGGYLIGLYQNGQPYVVDSSAASKFAYEREEVIPVSEEISNETPSVNLADRSDYFFQYQIMFRATRGSEVKTALKEFRDYFFDNKQHTIDGYTVSFKTSRGDKQPTVPVQSGNFYSFYKITVYLTAIKDGYIKKDADAWYMRLKTVDATTIVIGKSYQIVVVGTTDFQAIGASADTIGVIFVATGVGTGTGTVIMTALAITAPASYQTMKLASDTAGMGSTPIYSNKDGSSKGTLSNTVLTSKLQAFYDSTDLDKVFYQINMNKVDKDALWDVRHIFDGVAYNYDGLISSVARTLLDNAIVILDINWIEADI